MNVIISDMNLLYIRTTHLFLTITDHFDTITIIESCMHLFQYVLIFCFVRYEPAKYGDYVYPVWADCVGWGLALLSVVPMVVTAIYRFARAPGDTLKEKWRNATRPNIPIEQKHVSTIELESHDKVCGRCLFCDRGWESWLCVWC